MTLRVSGKNLDIGESLRSYVGARLDSVVTKYSAEPTSGHVTVEREGSGFRTDCILRFEDGIILQVEAEAQDAYASFNKAADRIETRLRRLKRRLRDHSGFHAPHLNGDAATTMTVGASDRKSAEPDATTERTPLVIAEPIASLKEMSVYRAVEELDVGNTPVIVFRHAGDGRTNIVYRRADGNIGWIETAAPSESTPH